MRIFAFLLILLPAAEIYFSFRLVRLLGGTGALLWLGGTFVIGSLLCQSLRRRLADSATRSGAVNLEGGEAVAILAQGLGGFFLLLPGILSDLAGVFLLFPVVGRSLGRPVRWIARRLGFAIPSSDQGAGCDDVGDQGSAGDAWEPRATSRGGSVRDAEFEVIEEADDT